jgi:hypothetical protein
MIIGCLKHSGHQNTLTHPTFSINNIMIREIGRFWGDFGDFWGQKVHFLVFLRQN